MYWAVDPKALHTFGASSPPSTAFLVACLVTQASSLKSGERSVILMERELYECYEQGWRVISLAKFILISLPPLHISARSRWVGNFMLGIFLTVFYVQKAECLGVCVSVCPDVRIYHFIGH